MKQAGKNNNNNNKKEQIYIFFNKRKYITYIHIYNFLNKRKWVSFTVLALLRSLAEYSRSMALNTKEEAASAAAISAETSEPGNCLLTA